MLARCGTALRNPWISGRGPSSESQSLPETSNSQESSCLSWERPWNSSMLGLHSDPLVASGQMLTHLAPCPMMLPTPRVSRSASTSRPLTTLLAFDSQDTSCQTQQNSRCSFASPLQRGRPAVTEELLCVLAPCPMVSPSPRSRACDERPWHLRSLPRALDSQGECDLSFKPTPEASEQVPGMTALDLVEAQAALQIRMAQVRDSFPRVPHLHGQSLPEPFPSASAWPEAEKGRPMGSAERQRACAPLAGELPTPQIFRGAPDQQHQPMPTLWLARRNGSASEGLGENAPRPEDVPFARVPCMHSSLESGSNILLRRVDGTRADPSMPAHSALQAEGNWPAALPHFLGCRHSALQADRNLPAALPHFLGGRRYELQAERNLPAALPYFHGRRAPSEQTLTWEADQRETEVAPNWQDGDALTHLRTNRRGHGIDADVHESQNVLVEETEHPPWQSARTPRSRGQLRSNVSMVLQDSAEFTTLHLSEPDTLEDDTAFKAELLLGLQQEVHAWLPSLRASHGNLRRSRPTRNARISADAQFGVHAGLRGRARGRTRMMATRRQ